MIPHNKRSSIWQQAPVVEAEAEVAVVEAKATVVAASPTTTE
jgi:hypothetical protein